MWKLQTVNSGGNMRIFQNKPIKSDEIDYENWESVNGDFILIKNMRIEYLEQCISTLELYARQYPGHANRAVWEQYLEVMEEELAIR